VLFRTRHDIKAAGRIAIPQGTRIKASVTAVKTAVVNGKPRRAEMVVSLEEIVFANGAGVPLDAEPIELRGRFSRLKLRYTLGYYPSPTPAGTFHAIDVRLADRFGTPDSSYSILSRRGYYDGLNPRRRVSTVVTPGNSSACRHRI
jgi:hypothetical protein